MQDHQHMEAVRRTVECEALRGKRYIAYARCACATGSALALRKQVRLIRQFGDSLDMQCVDEVRLVANGCQPSLRADLRDLLARKRKRDDYDVLIMEDFARLTRTGRGPEIEAKFGKCGIRIVYVTQFLSAAASL